MTLVESVNAKSGVVVVGPGDVGAVATSELGLPGGVATLDGSGALTSAQLPSSVVSSNRTTAIYAANSFGFSTTKTAAENGEAMEALETFLTTEGNVTVLMPEGISSNKGLVVKSVNVTLKGGSITFTNAGTGIKSTAAGTTIEGLRLTGGGCTTGINCEGTSARVLNNIVSGVTSSSTSGNQGAGIIVSGDDSRVEDNSIYECGGEHTYNQMAGIKAAGVTGTSGRRITIRGNRSYKNSTHGIYATGCDNLLIDGNYCFENGEYAHSVYKPGENEPYGRGITIGLGAFANIKIVDNYLFLNYESGLILGGGASETGAVVRGNHAYKNNRGEFKGGHGLEIDVTGALVEGNYCYENHNGISVNGALVTLVGNQCFLNKEVASEAAEQGCGIKCYFFTGSSAPLLILIGNTCYENDNSGIFVKGESGYTGPTIIGNRLYTNGVKGNSGNNYDLYVDKNATHGHYESNYTTNTAFRVRIEDESRWVRANTSASGNSATKTLEIKAGTTTLELSGEGYEMVLVKAATKQVCEIKAPESTGRSLGRLLVFRFDNLTGEEMGTITFQGSLFKMGAFTTPKSEKRKCVSFMYDGEAFVEVSQSAEY